MIQRDPPDWCRRGDLRDELLNGEIFCTLQERSDHHRKLVSSLQCEWPACLARPQTTSTGGLHTYIFRVAGSAP
jgi:hypothetical protein